MYVLLHLAKFLTILMQRKRNCALDRTPTQFVTCRSARNEKPWSKFSKAFAFVRLQGGRLVSTCAHKKKLNEEFKNDQKMLLLMIKGATQAQAQGRHPFCLPSCLTSRGDGIESSVKKWFSVHASVLMLM